MTHRLHVGIRPRLSPEALAAKRAFAAEHGRPTSTRKPACACEPVDDDPLHPMGRPITVSADDPDVAAMMAGTSDIQHRINHMHARGAEYRSRQVIQGVHIESDPEIAGMAAGETENQERLRLAREDQKVDAREAKLRWEREKRRGKSGVRAQSHGEHFPDQGPD
jgi:hypothetical protein